MLKSGCKVEEYRLAATSTEALLGFLSVIAAELLRLTYLYRTQPRAPAQKVLRPVQLSVLKAKSPQLPPPLTVAWALESVAWLGGYLQHRRKSPIGIQVLWRGWLKLESLYEGWSLVHQTSREKSEGKPPYSPSGILRQAASLASANQVFQIS